MNYQSIRAAKEFSSRARIKHADKYLYNKVKYVSAQSKVVITCSIHGDFEQTPHKHLCGDGCPFCGKNSCRGNLIQFIAKSVIIHSNKYDYSRVSYVNNKTKVKIVCPKHGEFEQTPKDHVDQGKGCKECGTNRAILRITSNTEDFIIKSKSINKDHISYHLVNYVNNKTKVELWCNKCQRVFVQTPNDHLSKSLGCPKCANLVTKPEDEICELLSQVGLKYVRNIRSIIPPQELDIYLPGLKLAIEFNGLYWHNEKHKPRNYHRDKMMACTTKGIELIQIWSDDWKHKCAIIKSIILNKIARSNKRVYARKCVVITINTNLASEFYLHNHLLGKCNTNVPVHYGLVHNDDLVSVMSFTKSGSQRGPGRNWELVRFASSINTTVVGGAARLFSKFIAEWSPSEVVSFSDEAIFSGGVYQNLKFSLESVLPPDYKVILKNCRVSKQTVRKSRIKLVLKDGVYDSNKTEHQMCLESGIYRIYDAGKKKWLWRSSI